MTSRVYIYLLGVAAVLVSVTGAFFSVSGLVALFSGSALSVATMAGSLEFSKFVLVGFVYRYWGHIHRPLRAYLVFSIFTLMVITSTGIYGYLSNAYQSSSVILHSQLMEIGSMQAEGDRIQGQIDDLQSFIAKIPNSRISKKFEFQQTYEPRIRDLREQHERLLRQIDDKKQNLLVTNTKVGPVVYIAQSLGVDIDTVVKYLILVFVSVFDPLAVSLVFCLNLLIRLREKYRGDDYKIGARSLTSPVDHRYSKVA
jgi:hypothetical protein